MKDFTVIVPIYNVENYLRRCIESIIKQTCMPKEIILVNDGSTDGSGAIADEFAEKYDSITVIHKDNGGSSSARNAGLKIIKTKYVTFVDSDDYLSLDMYEKLFAQLEEYDADISICGVWYEEESGEKSTPYKQGIKKFFTKTDALKELNSYRYFNMSFCDKIFRTSLFFQNAYGEGNIEFPVENICEDLYIMHKIIARAEKIVYSSEPLYHYVQRGGSKSRGKTPNTDILEGVVSQVEFYQRWFPDIAYIAESACAFHYISVYGAFIKRKLECPPEILSCAKKYTKKYFRSVMKNDVVPTRKKIQTLIFRYAFFLYKYII